MRIFHSFLMNVEKECSRSENYFNSFEILAKSLSAFQKFSMHFRKSLSILERELLNCMRKKKETFFNITFPKCQTTSNRKVLLWKFWKELGCNNFIHCFRKWSALKWFDNFAALLHTMIFIPNLRIFIFSPKFWIWLFLLNSSIVS